MKNSAIELQSVSKTFTQAGVAIPLFNNVTYAFAQGHTYALTGVSGTGKSTLIALLAGLERPSTGKITWNGQDLAKFSHDQERQFLHEHVGLIFQQPYLIAEFTVLENVMLKSMIANTDLVQARERAYALLDEVALIDKADRHPAALSGGEQQRVAIARALMMRPAFLLADEPTAHLDEKNKELVLGLLHTFQKESGAGMIISSHDPEVARTMRRVLTVFQGNLIEQEK